MVFCSRTKGNGLTRFKEEILYSKNRETLELWLPREVEDHHSQKPLKSDWIHCWVIGLDDLQKSLPTKVILWFYLTNSMAQYADLRNPRVSDFNVRNHSDSESILISGLHTRFCLDGVNLLHSSLYIAFTVVFCREFVTKPVLITLQCFYYCWAMCAHVKGYSQPTTLHSVLLSR